jgi:hypothetical protein
LGEKKKELEENRKMIMAPYWIRTWPAIMKAFCWNEVDVRINLGRCDRILLIEPEIRPLTDEEILSFFNLVQVPIEVEPMDLTHFRCVLAQCYI